MLEVLPRRVNRPLAAAVATAVISIGLTGCLSGGGGGGGSSSPPTPTGPATLSATVDQGALRGIELESGVLAFRGIRYGAAPTGERRFAAPQPAPAWTGTLSLSADFGSSCPQIASPFGEASTNEDCLFLNVYRPTAPGDYPVMVWIHGGAFIYGSGGPAYEASRLVQEGVVVVTLNYRLGALGFLPHADLGDANFGLQDQQLALKWVRDNIAAFDGDPDNVTIFGESAGGHSVLSQIASPGAAGLFHKAIVQSGSYNGDQVPLADLSFGPVTIPGGQSLFGNPTVAKTDCKDETGAALVSCLRGLTVEQLLAAQPGNILPVTGTTVLPRSINAALQNADHFNNVPVMMGSNRDEGSLFTLLALGTNPAAMESVESYRAAVAALLVEDPRLDAVSIADHYLSLEPAAPAPIPALETLRRINAYTAIGTDWRFNCPNDRQWTLLADKVDTYGYWFTDRGAPPPATLPASPFPLGAAHSFEIQYVLNSLSGMEARGASQQSLDLARSMASYWANFAKYGDNREIGPNSTSGAAGEVTWPRYVNDGNIINLGTPTPSVVPVSDFRTIHRCEFWYPQP